MSKIADNQEPIVMSGEAWTDKLLELIEKLPQEQQENWQKLAVFARSASASKPTAKWLTQAEPLLNAVGITAFNQFFQQAIQHKRNQTCQYQRLCPKPNDQRKCLDCFGIFGYHRHL